MTTIDPGVLDPAAAAVEATPLSVAMRDGSRAQHDDAEGSTFVSELMGGRVSEVGYVNYLRALRPIYAALEETGRALADHPVVGALHDSDLERLESLDADIAAWSTGEPDETRYEGHSARAYAAAIEATREDPVRFVAHHYTRYLGDLSGGQAIARILDREFAREGRGLSFYDFASIDKVKLYKDGYRARLDELPLSDEQRAEVVSEVQAAFSHNQAVFAELGNHLDAFRR